MDRDDVGLAQARSQFGFPPEPGAVIFVRGQMRGEHLERHHAPVALVVCPVDLPHPTPAEEGFDPVRAEAFPVCHRRPARECMPNFFTLPHPRAAGDLEPRRLGVAAPFGTQCIADLPECGLGPSGFEHGRHHVFLCAAHLGHVGKC